MPNIFEQHLDRNPANYAPLSPIPLLERAASVFPDRPSVVHGARRYTWSETWTRARRLGSALAQRGIGKGDTVAAMLPNIPEMFECHFGVPLTGAIFNALNTRLDAATIAFILNHGEAKILITDREYAPIVASALERIGRTITVIDVDDFENGGGAESVGLAAPQEMCDSR